MLYVHLPLLYLFAVSIADAGRQAMSKIYFLPTYFSLDSYKNVLSSIYVWYGFLWSIVRTVLGTIIALIFGYHYAYALSKRYLPNRGFWTTILIITMFFSGGLVPEYLLVKDLGLRNTIWALVLPGAISAYNITIMRNFLMAMPDSLEESARIDGANDLTIFIKIALPLSLPIIATLTLFYAVGQWNSYFGALIYTSQKRDMWTLQLLLREIINTTASLMDDGTSVETLPQESVRYATIVLATAPILCVYPFLQKYFVKGMMVGAVKG